MFSNDHRHFTASAVALAASSTLASAAPEPMRGADGRFTGAGAFVPDTPAPAAVFDDVAAAQAKLAQHLDRVVSTFVAHGPVEDGHAAPVSVIKASAGAGKSRALREAVAKHRDALTHDMAYYTPTLALAEEAAEHARSLGGAAFVIRGRTAENPANPATRMCMKAELAERLGKLGAPVGPSLCRAKDPDTGEVLTCEHYATCAYLRQFAALPSGPAQIFLTHAALDLPYPEGRDVALRVIDEAFWRQMARASTISVADFIGRRDPDPCYAPNPEFDVDATVAAAERAALDLIQNLRAGRPALAGGLKSASFEDFALIETMGEPALIDARPNMARADVEAALIAAEGKRRLGWRRARIWRILARAAGRRRSTSECIRLRTDERQGEVIEFFWRDDAPDDRPVILLDADADADISGAFYCPDDELETRLRPNAEVFQVHDRTMSRSALAGSRGMRDDWVAIIRREVLIDAEGPKGGVLVGATRKIVKQFFEDAGHDFTGKSDAEVSRLMLDTPLHGASWLWFGGRALGSNAWRDCSSVIVIGREELPIDVLEGQARAIFGDSRRAGIAFVAPDADGRVQIPEAELHYTMADGSAWAVMARAHPDQRVRALQMQSREWASLQLIERLRLAHAPYRKRVIIGCKVPIPGFPVDHLISWQELKPTRAECALMEGAERGGLRLSHGGLSVDAPATFGAGTEAKDPKAGADLVKKWRKGLPVLATGGGASLGDILSGVSPLAAVEVVVRIGASRVAVPALVFPASGETVEQAAARVWPAIKTMELSGRQPGYAEALVLVARGALSGGALAGDDSVDADCLAAAA
jgi:hypothetical protein